MREKLVSSEKLNEYLRKQVEIYHITHGNVDLLLEMGQKLNLTKDELEQYKEKLAKIQSISDSLPTNRRTSNFATQNSDANMNTGTDEFQTSYEYRFLLVFKMYRSFEIICRRRGVLATFLVEISLINLKSKKGQK